MSRKRTFWVVTVCGLVFVASLGLSIYTLIRESEDRNKIGSVQVVGPCREYGPNHPECKRQSGLIFESCVRHDLHPACTLAKQALRRKGRNTQSREGRFPLGNEGEKEPETRGGDAPSADTSAPSPAPPSPGGGGGSGGGGDGGSPSPPSPPPSPSQPSSKPDIGIDLDAPCPVNALGIEVCRP